MDWQVQFFHVFLHPDKLDVFFIFLISINNDLLFIWGRDTLIREYLIGVNIWLDKNRAVLLESVFLKEFHSHNWLQAHIHFSLHPISNWWIEPSPCPKWPFSLRCMSQYGRKDFLLLPLHCDFKKNLHIIYPNQHRKCWKSHQWPLAFSDPS